MHDTYDASAHAPSRSHAAVTPIPLKVAARGLEGDGGVGGRTPAATLAAVGNGANVAPGSGGPPSSGALGGLTGLKQAATLARSGGGQENGGAAAGGKRKASGGAGTSAAPLNNPFVRRPTKQSKA